MKVLVISISYKKLSERPCLFSPRVVWGGSKGYDIQNIITLKIGKYSDFEAESCQKYRLYGEKFKIKAFGISISYQKLNGAHMPVSSQSGPRGLLSSQIRYKKIHLKNIENIYIL